ncbi:two-component system, OmpR family, sensor histidine kinase MtrB [Amycolatopsis sacchari]|uniref:histidine kinase n=1 Tax=Amycolatopsis sacchari TaxID=115433 RepID=A0A1I3KEP5_9PSEU|nr:HAMP domain-containing sensor histidine kinase [Amycolatopsis sacchari]SFI70962.1 two-component system, OmpR family, sensor histidine kinase MtrB [Amycolatopsis sacchari]
MKRRLGLGARIAITVVLTTVGASAALAVAVYTTQSASARDRFVTSATLGFRSDVQQAVEHRAPCRAAVPDCTVDAAAEYMGGRLGLTWALVDLRQEAPGPRERGFVPVQGNTGWRDGQLPVDRVEQARAAGGEPVTYDYTGPDGSFFVVTGLIAPGIVLAEFYNTAGLDREIGNLRTQLAVLTVVVALTAAAIALLAVRQIQRPVRAAAVAARRLGAGALDTRLPVHGRDELAELAGSFNLMAQRLGESIDELRRKDAQQRRFVADVAHDLRTPLASLAVLTDSLDSPDHPDRARSVELLGTQVRRLGALVEDLLEISRIDAGVAEFRPEPIDLAELVRDAIGMVSTGEEVALTATGDTTVEGDARRVHTIVRNLLSNAEHHGAPPVGVTIDGTDPHLVTVTVVDHGPGVPAHLAPVVFDRFVRGDRARSYTAGSGLGLSIAQENAIMHGGRITVRDVEGAGAAFTLTLPRGSTPARRVPG